MPSVHIDFAPTLTHIIYPACVVRISMAEIRSEDPALSIRLRYDPLRHLRALEAACHSIACELRPGYDKENVRVKVALAGPIGASAASPRSLTSSSLRQLVCVEGVATKVSLQSNKMALTEFLVKTSDRAPFRYLLSNRKSSNLFITYLLQSSINHAITLTLPTRSLVYQPLMPQVGN